MTPTTASPSVAAFAAALADPTRLSTRAVDRLKMAHDASHYALTPLAVAVPVNAAEVGRLFAASVRSVLPLTFRSGGTSLSGQAGHGGGPRRHPEALPRHRGPRRWRPRQGGAGRDRAAGQRAARAPWPQARARPRERDRLHPWWGRRQQLERDGVRNRRQHLRRPSTRWSSSCRAAPSSTPARPTPTSGCAPSSPSCTPASPGSGTGSAATPTRSGLIEQQFSMKNTMGYGLNSLPRPRPSGRHPRPPRRR